MKKLLLLTSLVFMRMYSKTLFDDFGTWYFAKTYTNFEEYKKKIEEAFNS